MNEKAIERYLPTVTGKSAKKTARNFWLEARVGLSLDDDSLRPEKTIAGGSHRIMAGMDVLVYQRNGPFADSIALATKIECRTEPDGQLRLRVLHPKTNAVLWEYETHRDGGEVV